MQTLILLLLTRQLAWIPRWGGKTAMINGVTAMITRAPSMLHRIGVLRMVGSARVGYGIQVLPLTQGTASMPRKRVVCAVAELLLVTYKLSMEEVHISEIYISKVVTLFDILEVVSLFSLLEPMVVRYG